MTESKLPVTVVRLDPKLAARAQKVADKNEMALSELIRLAAFVAAKRKQTPVGAALRTGERSVSVKVRMTAELKGALQACAAWGDVSISTWLARALADGLAAGVLTYREDRGPRGALIDQLN